MRNLAGWLILLELLAFCGSAPTAAQQDPSEEPDSAEPETQPAYDEVIVVTASKLQETLVNAPAAVSVLPSNIIVPSPAQNYGDLLRLVPGVNVVQLSARDVNVASRTQSGTAVTSGLALVDGRTVYQDFFGIVMWDFLPLQMFEVDRIEVIRGPVSAVWGANAMTGVVNVITKAPRDMAGTTLTVGFGGFDRSVGGDDDEDPGTLFSLNATHARIVNDRLAFKISAGTFTQSTLPRPTGVIPNQFETPYPSFPNQGSRQPKLDARFDFDLGSGPRLAGDEHRLLVGGGIAGASGVIHTGIGPLDIRPGSLLGYGKMNYQRGSFKLNLFVNAINGGGPALLAEAEDEELLIFRWENQTVDVEASDFRLVGDRHLLSYGGNVRQNLFDLSIAPGADGRREAGFYAEDEVFLSEHFRWVIGGRFDWFDVLERVVFSPRTAILFKPQPAHTIRFSFNRAFRAPSFLNNFLDLTFLNGIDLTTVDPDYDGELYKFPVTALGSDALQQESLRGYELGYTGVIRNRVTLGLSYYITQTRDIILFSQTSTYDSDNPPPGWPLAREVLDDLIAEGRGLPEELAFENFDRVRDHGVELSVEARLNASVKTFANYSWQDDPSPRGFEISELNLPPSYRLNAGVEFDLGRYFGNVSASFVDGAFWQDVLDARFHGPTEAYSLVNAAFGMRWEEDRLTTTVKVTNLTNSDIQQHVFGDVIKRLVVGELQFRF